MSGIYIKGMEMPKNCLSCPLQGGIADCRLTQKTYNWGLSERPSDCPLISATDHGRLIDADAMAKDEADSYMNKQIELAIDHRMGLMAVNEGVHKKTQLLIKAAPTIIPADKKTPCEDCPYDKCSIQEIGSCEVAEEDGAE